MSVEHVDADGLHPPQGYTHASAAPGGTLVHCAGQVAMDADGGVVGVGDHAAQAERALANVLTALRAAGAEPQDVVKITYYVVGMTEETVHQVNRGLSRTVRATGMPPVPATMVGVTALSIPELLIEADAVAVVD